MTTRDLLGAGLAVLGLVMALLVLAEWGRASYTPLLLDNTVATASFPGMGQVSLHFTASGTDNTINGSLAKNDLTNTDAGWPAMLFGALIVVTGLLYWKSKFRLLVGMVAAILGLIATAIFISDLADLAGTFGNQARIYGAEYSPGIGLIASCVIAVAVVGLGLTGILVEWRSPTDTSGL